MPKRRLKLDQVDSLDDTQFEELCFELLQESGFVNVDWRKGTALSTSPADRGRDIVAQHDRTDIDGTKHLETWFVDCKRYKKGVPPEKLQGLLAWANAERSDVALFIASGYLSNPAKDYLRDYQLNNRPPFRIKYWERPVLERLASGHEDLIRRFLFEVPRNESEIIAAEEEFFDKVWYVRSVIHSDEETADLPEDIRNGMLAHRKRIEEQYGRRELHKMIGRGHDKAWEYGYVNGKLAALRWVLGDEWDFLDT
jgi:hypothetical protein